MTTFQDYYNLTIPDRALDLGMVDVSWHNDAAARMIHKDHLQEFDAQANGEDKDGDMVLTFWCGDSGTAHELGESYRYMVGWEAHDRDTVLGEINTESLDEALDFLEAQVTKRGLSTGRYDATV